MNHEGEQPVHGTNEKTSWLHRIVIIVIVEDNSILQTNNITFSFNSKRRPSYFISFEK